MMNERIEEILKTLEKSTDNHSMLISEYCRLKEEERKYE